VSQPCATAARQRDPGHERRTVGNGPGGLGQGQRADTPSGHRAPSAHRLESAFAPPEGSSVGHPLRFVGWDRDWRVAAQQKRQCPIVSCRSWADSQPIWFAEPVPGTCAVGSDPPDFESTMTRRLPIWILSGSALRKRYTRASTPVAAIHASHRGLGALQRGGSPALAENVIRPGESFGCRYGPRQGGHG
jgi:hypothetical protein